MYSLTPLLFPDNSKLSWAARTMQTVTKRRPWLTSWRGSNVTRWLMFPWMTTRTGESVCNAQPSLLFPQHLLCSVAGLVLALIGCRGHLNAHLRLFPNLSGIFSHYCNSDYVFPCWGLNKKVDGVLYGSLGWAVYRGCSPRFNGPGFSPFLLCVIPLSPRSVNQLIKTIMKWSLIS